MILWVADDEQGVNRFVRLADDSDEVPKLRKRQYADFKLTNGDWLQLSLLHEALQVCRSYPFYCSTYSYLTATRRNLQTRLKVFQAQSTRQFGE
jgi:hypothetical protein